MKGRNTAALFKRVKIFITDVDGVLTNSTVLLSGKAEFKQFNIQDGMGLRLLQHTGIPVGWVSNRKSAATTARCSSRWMPSSRCAGPTARRMSSAVQIPLAGLNSGAREKKHLEPSDV